MAEGSEEEDRQGAIQRRGRTDRDGQKMRAVERSSSSRRVEREN